jgi:CopG family nickel-responsive transcriptional regulator
VSSEGEFLRRFYAFISRDGYTNRSKAIADLLRNEFLADVFEKGGAAAGAAHHKREVVNELLDMQHDHGAIIISAL